jgi:hypothetical protein
MPSVFIPSEPKRTAFAPPPPPYGSAKGKVRQLLIDEKEVDYLRIQCIRRCESVAADIAKLQQGHPTYAEFLGGADAIRKCLVDRVDFKAVEEIEQAADRLADLLGEDGWVQDPRPQFGSMGDCRMPMEEVRAMVAALAAAVAPYRKMREQLK